MGDVTVNIHVTGSEVDVRRHDHGSTAGTPVLRRQATEAMTVEFRGLCSFVERPNEKVYEVYLLSGLTDPVASCDPDKMKHTPTLVIPTFAINATVKGAASPSQIVNIGGVELGIWLLDGKQVTFSTSTSGLPDGSQAGCIDLNKLHKHRVKPKGKIDNGYGVVTLSGGTLTGVDVVTLDYKRPKDTGMQQIDAAFGVVWTPASQQAPTILFDGKPRIFLNKTTTIWITNVAASMAGMLHFGFYYTLIDGNVDCDERIELHPPMAVLNENTYGCTPPTSGS